jgi:putative phosphoribosyl transferase
MLAQKLKPYKNQNVTVIALSKGAVIVGAQIAMELHGNLALLLTEGIYLPGEFDAIAGLSSEGTYTHNSMFTAGEIEEMVSEYNQYLEQQKMEKMHRMNLLLGHEGEIDRNMLRRHVVIVVSDGLPSGFSLDVAADYLKTVAVKKLIIASPIASISAVDRMHLLGDEIYCLSVPGNYMETDHYYDDNTIPDVDGAIKIIRNISLNWHRQQVAISPKTF